MCDKKLTIPERRKVNSSQCHACLAFSYQVHRAIVKHPVHVTSYPHTCTWINQTIPRSSSFLKQPFAVFTVRIGIRFQLGETVLVFELHGHWPEETGIFQNRRSSDVNDGFTFIISWQFRYHRSVRTYQPSDEGNVVEEIKELLLDFFGQIFQI